MRDFGIVTRTEIQLDAHHLLALPVRAGETLGSQAGTVWVTIDNELDDILLLFDSARGASGFFRRDEAGLRRPRRLVLHTDGAVSTSHVHSHGRCLTSWLSMRTVT